MEIPANYIRRIEIHGLWHRYDIAWDLRPDVNILAGINGVGKTTILNRSVGYLEQTTGQVKNEEKNGVRVFFDRPDATFIPYDVIRSYDRPLVTGDFTARMADPEVRSELDWQLYLLQRRYLDYQVNPERHGRTTRPGPRPLRTETQVPGPDRRTLCLYGQED